MEYLNQIVLTKDDFGEDLWKCVGEQLNLICESEYIATVRDDDTGIGIIVIQFASKNDEYGEPYPEWLTPDEREELYYQRCHKGDEKHNQQENEDEANEI